MSSAKITPTMLKKAREEFARSGGAARARALSKQRRVDIARQGAMKRWYKDCFECRGTGQVHSIEDESAPEYDSGKFKDCSVCGGTGKVRKVRK